MLCVYAILTSHGVLIKKYDARHFKKVLMEGFWPHIKKRLSRKEISTFLKCDTKYHLCPVTRRIIWRYMTMERGASIDAGPCEVFISFYHEDVDFARLFSNYITHNLKKQVFFSEETMNDPNYSIAIDKALDSADRFIAVATNPSHLERNWPQFECRAFHLDILNGIKKRAKLFSIITGFNPVTLPRPHRYFDAIQYDPKNERSAFEKLARFIR